MATETAKPLVKTARISTAYVYFVAVVVSLGSFLIGYCLVIISGAIIFLKARFNLNPAEVGFAVSSAAGGCILGPLIGGAIADAMGRRRALTLTGILFAASALGTALPTSMLAFNIFRMIGGMGVGIASAVLPIYLSEIAPARIRGRLVAVYQLAMVIGGLSSVTVSYLLSSSGNWRWMLGAQLFPSLGLLIGVIFVPESPRWLVEKHRFEEARRILGKIGGDDYAESEEREIVNFISSDREKASFSELLRKGTRIALLIAVGLAVLQQLSGDNIIFLYAPIIFQKAGFVRAQDALRETVLMSCWNLVCTLIAFWSVDRLGRRPLLLAGTFGMMVGFVLMGGVFYLGITGWPVLAVVLICVGAYASGLAPVSWLIMSEIFSTRLRGRAMAVASFAVWLSFFISGQAFPPAVAYLEKRFGNIALAFWVCACVSCLAFIFAWKMVPETKGRALEEIAASWTKGEPG